MKVTLENTSEIVTVDGAPVRVWEGQTESGIPIVAFIARIAVASDQPCEDFEKELQEVRPPSIGALIAAAQVPWRS